MIYGPIPIQGDSESLQTDVMRFMAIIGFCLIAILALVKEAAPVTAAVQAQSLPVEPTVTENTTQTSEVTAAAPRPAVMERASEPVPETAPSATADAVVTPRWQEPLAKPAVEITVARPTPIPKPHPVVAAQPPPSRPAPEASEQPGLSLRFASDGDFLRLIAKGDIKVYAYASTSTGSSSNTDILMLDGDYQFRTSPAPGKVYELLPDTIPALVVNALRSTGRDSGAFTWAIVLPGRIEAQLGRYLDQVKSGQLVIDRYGEVQHVAPG